MIMSIRRKPSEAEIAPCLDFAPVPRVYNRYDGWTPARQRGFIEALARLGTVKAAAAHVAMSAEGAYHLRRQIGARSFADAWEKALAIGVESLRDIAYSRAVEGTPKGVWYHGERVGEEQRYNDRLLMFILRREQPATYGPLKMLRPGTKHPDTVARERERIAAFGPDTHVLAARNRLEDASADPYDDPRAIEIRRMMEGVAEIYMRKLAGERRARLAGAVVEADFLLRQLTHIEVLLEACDGEPLIEGLSEDLYAPDAFGDDWTETYSTDASRIFDAMRREIWTRLEEPPRPVLGDYPDGPVRFVKGTQTTERRAAQEEARAVLAAAQAKWEAAATEEGWRQWTEGAA